MTDNDIDEDGRYTGAERELLRRALKASGMSARQAAAKMDISDTRLRHVINGYQPVGRGQRIAVVAPEDTLARIAAVLHVTPEELAAAGREDAARELRTRQREIAAHGDDSFAIVEAITAWAEDPVNYIPPDDALRFFDDSALLGEIERRLGNLRAHLAGDTSHGFFDVSSQIPYAEGGDGDAQNSRGSAPIDELSERQRRTTDLPAAALDEGSIAAEQEDRNEP